VSDNLTLATIDELRKKLSPRVPNAARINKRTLDVLRQHIDLSNTSTPFGGVQISIAEGMPDGKIAFGWDSPSGFELNAIYTITDVAQSRA
jgi:hypothetical protein